ncbi:hypothetical protein B0H67DRAFT_566450 [Lasiosphaeris hirsuta]|uniref:2EXR domain-containing protein n=1 Tax=Lasiosphaeris hirsuta TaxID=260670 RepID=A0AA40EC66_9PEZI|nr:hypothetical protein B0H67DRAFT_566450 [Lasiosphaeris hirsuta]
MTPPTPPTPPILHLFAHLPSELRVEIWRVASTPSATSNSDRAVCILPNVSYTGPTPRLVFESGNAAMLSTSHEARKIARETAIIRPYNPKTDMLYIPVSKFNSHHINLSTMAGTWHGFDWLHEVRHIGIAPPDRYVLHTLAYGLSKLCALETVSIVYLHPPGVPPAMTATGGKQGDILPAWYGASARLVGSFKMRDSKKRREEGARLSAQWCDEREQMKQFCGGVSGLKWGGLEESCWFWPEIEPSEDANERKKRVREQLEDLEYALNRHHLGGPHWRTRCWDRHRSWLKLAYETRCLQGKQA